MYKILAVGRKYGLEFRIRKVHRAYPSNGQWFTACGSRLYGETKVYDETEYTGFKSTICGNCWRHQITVRV